MTEPIKYYTGAGDDGTTGLLGEGRVKKYSARPMTVGDVDEAQAALGLARASMKDSAAAAVVLQAQRDLYHVMAELSATPVNAARFRKIDGTRVAWLEAESDAYGARISLPGEFTVSGDSQAGAALDLARTVIRRAERGVARLFDEGEIENPQLLRYLNRLSSLVFVLSKYEDALSGSSDWKLARS